MVPALSMPVTGAQVARLLRRAVPPAYLPRHGWRCCIGCGFPRCLRHSLTPTLSTPSSAWRRSRNHSSAHEDILCQPRPNLALAHFQWRFLRRRLGVWLARFRGPAGRASTLARSSGWIGLRARPGRWRSLAGASSALFARGWSSTGSFQRGIAPGRCPTSSRAACALPKSTYSAGSRTRSTRCCPGDWSSAGTRPQACASTRSWCPAELRTTAGKRDRHG